MPGWLENKQLGAARLIGAARRAPGPLVTRLHHLLSLTLLEGFSVDELALNALLDPHVSLPGGREALPKRRLLALQHRINPAFFRSLTEDKLRFFQHCQAFALPTPAARAVFYSGSRSAAWLAIARELSLPILEGKASLEAFLRTWNGPALVIKPVDGALGRGVHVLDFVRDSSESAIAGQMSSLWAALAESGFERWLIQDRVEPHPTLAGLSLTRGLQTARVVTSLESTGEVEVVGASLRIIGGDTLVDNFSYGRTGNLSATLDPESGRITAAYAVDRDGVGLDSVLYHPRSGQPLIGFCVPDWPGVLELTRRAAAHFAPLRCLGWDVGLSSSGPVLVEANATWDPIPRDPRFRAYFDSFLPGGARESWLAGRRAQG